MIGDLREVKFNIIHISTSFYLDVLYVIYMEIHSADPTEYECVFVVIADRCYLLLVRMHSCPAARISVTKPQTWDHYLVRKEVIKDSLRKMQISKLTREPV